MSGPAAAAPLRVELEDPLDRERAPAARERLQEAIQAEGPVEVDLAAVRTVDLYGLATLTAAVRRMREAGRRVEVRGAGEEVRRLGRFLHVDEVLEPPPPPPPRADPLEALGDWTLRARDSLATFLSMLGEAYQHAVAYPARGAVAREQLWRQLVEVGQRAVPIVVLINFSIGLILAIQMAYTARSYGALIFVPRFVGISITREIGPLLTAVLVAARSGSAIAAELGTMRVTEEVDALEMMALDPRRFLLLPRFIALTVAVPALCVFADVAGILGGAVAGVLQYDFTWRSYYEETVASLQLRDVLSGLMKSLFFGSLVAVVGCLEGLRSRGGPEAVGAAATRAVVRAIVAVVLFDAVFTYMTKELL